MNNFRTNKQITEILTKIIAIIGLISLLILTSSLRALSFNPGQPMLFKPGNIQLLPIGFGDHGNWLLSLFITFLIALIPLGVIMLIFSPYARNIFKKNLKALAIWLFLVLSIRIYTLLFGPDENIRQESDTTTPVPNFLDPPPLSGNERLGNLESFSPPNLADWQGYLISFLFIITMGVFVYILWEKKRPKHNEFNKIVLKTLEEINQGRSWEDAVIQCYADMNTELQVQRRIFREEHLTPSEFAKILENDGLPSKPVRQLTQLFEQARYGDTTSESINADEAVHCLNAITLALDSSK